MQYDAQCCAYCTWMTTREAKPGSGKFKTEGRCPYNDVYAYQRYCDKFTQAFSRDTSDCIRLYRISVSHQFIVTAVSEILGLGVDNRYHDAFTYMRDVYLEPSNEIDHRIFLEEYEEIGQKCADKIRNDENAYKYALELKENYLDSFADLVESNDTEMVELAFKIYKMMFDEVKTKYQVKYDIMRLQLSRKGE